MSKSMIASSVRTKGFGSLPMRKLSANDKLKEYIVGRVESPFLE